MRGLDKNIACGTTIRSRPRPCKTLDGHARLGESREREGRQIEVGPCIPRSILRVWRARAHRESGIKRQIEAVARHILAALAAERPVGDDGQLAVIRPHRLADGWIFQEVRWRDHAAADAHVVDVAAKVVIASFICRGAAADHEHVVEECGNHRVGAAARLSHTIDIETAGEMVGARTLDDISDMMPHAIVPGRRMLVAVVKLPVTLNGSVLRLNASVVRDEKSACSRVRVCA